MDKQPRFLHNIHKICIVKHASKNCYMRSNKENINYVNNLTNQINIIKTNNK